MSDYLRNHKSQLLKMKTYAVPYFDLIDNIFKQYGYMIVENQSVFFMQKLYPTFAYIYVEIFALIFLGFLFFLVFPYYK